MNPVMNIVLSPYFSKNTKIVSNFCKKCYIEDEEVHIIAVNTEFLEFNDSKYYQIIKNNFSFLLESKQESSTPEENNNSLTQQKKVEKIDTIDTKPRLMPCNNTKRRNMKKYITFHRKNTKLQKTENSKVEEQEIIVKTERNEYHNNQKCSEEKTITKKEKQEDITTHSETNIKVETTQDTFRLKDKTYINELKSEKPYNVGLNNKWIPPLSPHNLIEEKYYSDPWALLVVTIFLNRTSCLLALPYMEKFFEDYKGPYDVLKKKAEHLEPYFAKIGLIKTRAIQVWRMSFDFVHKEWRRVGELYGVGKYAEDAYRMFHLGDFSVEPTDRYLKIYKAWYLMKLKNEEMGIENSNSQVYLEDYYVHGGDEDRTYDEE